MKATSGSSTGSFFPTAAASGSSNAGAATLPPTSEEPSTSFEDLLKQHEASGGSASSATWAGMVSDHAVKADPLPPIAPTTPAAPTVVADPTSLASLGLPALTMPAPETPTIPVAKRGAGNPLLDDSPKKDAPLTKGASGKTPSTVDSSKTTTLPLYSGSSILVARAALLAANARQNPTASPTSEADAESAATAPETAVGAEQMEDELSLLKLGGKTTGASPTEKKSANASSQGSFLQANTSTAAPSWMAFGTAGSSLIQIQQPTDNKSFAKDSKPTSLSPESMSSGAPATAGMANGKKETDMNATLDLPDTIVSTGSNPMVTRNSADVHILLGTNQDFKDALGQVMRVAELSGMSQSAPPLRVAIEIQTPPGAIVNVYVSKQDDGYRAQLSANDPQALSWVQDQIGSLRQSTDTGVQVRWLPAQLETGSATTASSSSSNDSGLGWDRGGQNQQGNQQQADDRQQARQKRPAFAGLISPASPSGFMNVIGTLGRAA